MAEKESRPEIRRLGEFELLHEIGHGGMGVVYEARDTRLERRVAVKILDSHLQREAEAVERFRRESLAVASLSHRHILPVYRVGEQEGVHYFVMELVDGPSLAEVLAELSTTPADALPAELQPFQQAPHEHFARVVAEVAEALEHAHQHNILHRDVKPLNILLRGDGSAALIDFGLAHEEGQPALTQPGQILGSPYYLPPEQLQHAPGPPTAVGDLYALGVVLYECLTSRRPFQGHSALAVIQQITTEDPPLPRKLNAAVPRDLEHICMKAMAREPAQRYQRGADLAADLRRFLRGEAVEGRSPWLGWGRVGRLQRRVLRRTPLLTSALALVAALSGWIWWHRPAPTAHLLLGSSQHGLVAELYSDADPGEPRYRFAVDRRDPLAVDPGTYQLIVRGRGHDGRVFAPDRGLVLRAGQTTRVPVWVPPFEPLWSWTPPSRIVRAQWLEDARDGNRLVVGCEEGELCALDPEGKLVFEMHVGSAFEQLTVVRRGEPAQDLVLVPDHGERLVGIDANGEVQLVASIPGTIVALTSVRWRGELVVCAGTDLDSIHLVSASGDVVDVLRGGEAPHRLCERALSSGRTSLLAEGNSGLVEWQPGEPPRALAHSGIGGWPTFLLTLPGVPGMPDGAAAIVWGKEREVRWWDGDRSREIPLPAPAAHAVSWDRGEACPAVAVACEDGSLWLLPGSPTGAPAAAIAPARGTIRQLLVASLDAGGPGQLVAVTQQELVLRNANGMLRAEIPLDQPPSQVLATDLDGRTGDELVVVQGRLVRVLSRPTDTRFERRVEDVQEAGVLPDTTPPELMAAAGSRLILHLAAMGATLGSLELPADRTCWSLSGGDAPRVWIGLEDGTLLCWIPREGRTFEVDLGSAVTCLALSPGDRLCVAGTADGSVIGVDPDGALAFRLQSQKSAIVKLLLTEDGAVAMAADGSTRVLREDGSPRAMFRVAGAGPGLWLLGDRGPTLVYEVGGELRELDLDGRELGRLPLAASTRSAARLADGRLAHLDTQGRLLLLGPGRVITAEHEAGSAWHTLFPVAGGAGVHLAAVGDGRIALLDQDAAPYRSLLLPEGARVLALADCDGDGPPEVLLRRDAGRFGVLSWQPDQLFPLTTGTDQTVLARER